METKDRLINYYLAWLAPVAIVAIGWAVTGFPFDRVDARLGVLAAATIFLSSVLRIQLPRHNIHLTISDALIILAMLFYGGEVAVLLAALETGYTAFNFRRRGISIRLRTILINVLVSAIVVFIASQVVELSFGAKDRLLDAHDETRFAGMLGLIAVTMFAVNTICVSPFLAIKNERSIRQVWSSYCLDAFVMYMIGALTAGLMLITLERINYSLFAAVVGIVALVYWTYKRNVDDLRETAAEAKNAEMMRAEQAENHVAELEHYVTELEETGQALRMSRERFRHAAYHDDLTGLPNRRQFFDLLQIQIEKSNADPSHKFALLFLDLNRFKTINESLGYSTGGRLLRHVAKRLSKLAGNGGVVGRFSGDEFAVLLPEVTGAEEAVDFAKRVADRISEPFRLGDRRVFTTVSIGIALGRPNYLKSEEILRDADIAMYRAKESRQTIVIFDEKMHSNAMSLLELETDLRFAVSRDEFEVFYQPIVDIESLRLSGFEALVRWKHPRRGIVVPNDFIPLSEATGLIVPMTLIILRKACSQLEQWRHRSYENRSLTMSVNLSGKHFAEPDLVDQIKAIVAETGIDPAYLKLEITESAVMENAENAIAMLKQIRETGVKLSIDDFGTGHSSLSYLHRFPVDTLKVDRSFVSTMDDGTENGEIVRTVITLAKALKLNVVAEGIETSQQLRQLRRLGCQLGQGYIFSGPLPAGGIEPLLADPLIWSDILPTNRLPVPPAQTDYAGYIFAQ
jgi:diguanylate cyclase (GGDEF)-like protein